VCSHVSTEISAPIRYLGIQFGYLGKTTLGKTTKTNGRRSGWSEEGGGRDKRVWMR
jgi:hypothetical protein